MSSTRHQGTRFHIEEKITGSGVIGPDKGFQLSGETSLKVNISNANNQNIINLEGRLNGQSKWTIIASFNNGTNESVDINGYDALRMKCVAHDATNKSLPVFLFASAFMSDFASTEHVKTEALLKEMTEHLYEIRTINKCTTDGIKQMNEYLKIIIFGEGDL